MDEEDFKIHQCPTLPKTGIDVLFSRNGIDGGINSVWNLVIRRESTEKDLEENHYIEMTGETLWETILEISHCPFCGQTLGNTDDECQGKFMHRELSDWTMNID